MIRAGFLDRESRKDLTELARDGSVPHRLARRANALVLLDGDRRKFWGASVNEVFPRLFFDREWTRGLGFEVGENRG